MILEKFKTIPGYDTWKDAESLNKGFSGEQKYIITSNDGNKFLLRVSKMETYEEKKKQYELLQKVEKLNINSSKPICFGKLNEEEVYMVLSWVEGEDAEVAVKHLTDKEAYLLGVETGKVLAKLHEIPVDESNEKSKCCEKWFSIVNSNCSKGNAIKILIKYLNLPIENTIAIGNDKNDISMFEVVGLSVAVANASEDIKNKVDYITLSNDEDGVALFLESLL